MKLTLKDDARSSFKITAQRVSNGKQQFDYTGAQTGADEYISAIIKRNGNVIYYGKLAQSNSEAGTAEMTLPAGTEKTDEIYLFNEQATSAKTPDLSSALQKVETKLSYSVPSQQSTPKYDGKTFNLADLLGETYDATTMTLSAGTGANGAIAASKPGTYTAAVALKDKSGNPWDNGAGGTYDDQTITWKIDKAEWTVTWSDTTRVYTGQALHPTAKVPVYNADGSGGTTETDVSELIVVPTGAGVHAGTTTAELVIPQGNAYYDYYIVKTNPTTSFTITQATNEWTTTPAIAGWTQGDTPPTPTGAAKFGTVKFEYGQTQNGPFAETPPDGYGDFYMKASVSTTDDYTGLTQFVQYAVGQKTLIEKPTQKLASQVTYNGNGMAQFAAGTGYTITNEKKIAGGAYEAMAGDPKAAGEYRTTVTLTTGYFWTDDTRTPIAVEWTIAKAVYDLAGVTFADASFVYDGQAHSIELAFTGAIKSLPTGADGIPLTVSYLGNVTQVAQGQVQVTATFATESANYNVPEPLTAKVSITPRKVAVTWTGDVSYVYAPNLTLTLNANIAADAFITGDDVQLSVTGLDKTAPGNYTATATLTGTKAANYQLTSATKSFAIVKASAPAIDVTIDYAAETLSTTTELEYSTDNGTTWTKCAADMTIAEAMFGTSILLRWNDDHYQNNTATSFAIPARPDAPSELYVDTAKEGVAFGAGYADYRFYFEGDAISNAQKPSAQDMVRTLTPGEKIYIFKLGTATAFRSKVLTLTAPQRATPDVTLTIDYAGESTGENLPRTYEYTYTNPSGGTAEWTRGDAQKLKLEPGTYQKTLYYRVKATDTSYASEYTALILKERPPKPSDPSYNSETRKITGVDTSMEFKTESLDWTPVTGTDIDAYPGNYEIRYKATDANFASNVKQIYVQGQEQAALTIENFNAEAAYGDSFTVTVSQVGNHTNEPIQYKATGCATVDGSGKVTITGVGAYTVTATRPGDQIYTAVSNAVNGLAGKRTLSVQWINAEDRVYNGNPSELNVVLGNWGFPEDATQVTAVVTDGDKVNAGMWEASVQRLTGEKADCYKLPTTGAKKSYLIAKATYDMSRVRFDPLEVAYDGADHVGAIEIGGYLPSGVTVRYEVRYQNKLVTEAIEAGEYKVKGIFAGDTTNYEKIPEMTATLTITLNKIAVTVEWSKTSFVYNGQVQAPTAIFRDPSNSVVNLTAEAVYAGDYAASVDAGTYSVTVTIDSIEYEITGAASVNYAIEKAEYDMSRITFEAVEVPFDGTDKRGEIAIGGTLPDGVTVAYEFRYQGNVVTEAVNEGSYTVKAVFTGSDTVNHKSIDPMTATLTITLSRVSVTVTWDTTSFVYNGGVQAPKAIFKDAADNVIDLSAAAAYTGDYATSVNAGSYTVSVSIDSLEYALTGTKSATYTIAKATLTIPVFTGPIVYNGQEQDVTAYLSDFNDAIMNVSGGSGRNAGIYTAVLTLKDTAVKNCFWAGATGITVQVGWKIDKAQIVAVWSADEFVADGKGHAPELTGFTGIMPGDLEKLDISYSGDLDKQETGAYTISAVLAEKEGETVLRNYEVSNLAWAYVITPRPGMNVVTVEWSEDEFVYNGGVQHPKAIVKDREGNIIEDVEVIYEGDYADSVYEGEYAVTVNVPGNFFIKSGAEKVYTIQKDKDGNGAAPASDEPIQTDRFPLWQVIVTGASLLILIICIILLGNNGSKGKGYKKRKKRAETRVAGVAILPLILLGAPLFGMSATIWTVIAGVCAATAVGFVAWTGISSAHVGKLRCACEEAETDAERRVREAKEQREREERLAEQRRIEENRLAEERRREEERKIEEQRRKEEREEDRRREDERRKEERLMMMEMLRASAAQNNAPRDDGNTIYTSAVNVEEVIEGVMTRMLPVFQQMVDAVTPALPQPQAQPRAKAQAPPKQSAPAEAAADILPPDDEPADSMKEGIYIPDAESAVVFTASGADLESAYGNLPRMQKTYYNKLKEHALSMPGTLLYRTAQHDHVKIGRRSVIKMLIRRGMVVAQFVLENEQLRAFRSASDTRIRIRPVEIAVEDDAAFHTAMEMIDLACEQIARDKEEAKERKKEARRKRASDKG